MEGQSVHNRKHPHRLVPEEYRRFGKMVFVHSRCRGPLRLDQGDVASVVTQAFATMAVRFSVTICAYCVMPDHVHVVTTVSGDDGDLKKWFRYGKRQAAHRLGASRMWQRSYWDRDLRDDESLEAAVLYLLDNPVRKGLCERYTDWPYSWSQWHPETMGPPP